MGWYRLQFIWQRRLTAPYHYHPVSGRIAVVVLKYIGTIIHSIQVVNSTVIGTVGTENIFVQQITKIK